jgi:hypothetical protein
MPLAEVELFGPQGEAMRRAYAWAIWPAMLKAVVEPKYVGINASLARKVRFMPLDYKALAADKTIAVPWEVVPATRIARGAAVFSAAPTRTASRRLPPAVRAMLKVRRRAHCWAPTRGISS